MRSAPLSAYLWLILLASFGAIAVFSPRADNPKPVIVERVKTCDVCPPCVKEKMARFKFLSTITKFIQAGRRDRARIKKLEEELSVFNIQEKIYENSIDNLTNEITDGAEWPQY